MKRTPLPRRRHPLARGAPPRKRNPKRRECEFRRCYLSRAFVRFTQCQPCAACGSTEGSECAHTEGGGMSRKSGWETIAPLCSRCHHKSHQFGWMGGLGMTAEGRRRAAVLNRLAFEDHQQVGDTE